MSDEKKDIENDQDGIVYEAEEPDSEIIKLKKKLRECAKEKEQYLSGWQRAQADFINWRRRQEEQAGQWAKNAEEKLIRELLPFLDSLDAAVSAGDEGMATLKKQLIKILEESGLEEMRTIGEKFDPALHEAVECEECEKDEETSIISSQIQKGYLLNGKVIRHAKVKVKK